MRNFALPFNSCIGLSQFATSIQLEQKSRVICSSSVHSTLWATVCQRILFYKMSPVHCASPMIDIKRSIWLNIIRSGSPNIYYIFLFDKRAFCVRWYISSFVGSGQHAHLIATHRIRPSFRAHKVSPFLLSLPLPLSGCSTNSRLVVVSGCVLAHCRILHKLCAANRLTAGPPCRPEPRAALPCAN